MAAARWARRANFRTRFTKSYKYKHKIKMKELHEPALRLSGLKSIATCDRRRGAWAAASSEKSRDNPPDRSISSASAATEAAAARCKLKLIPLILFGALALHAPQLLPRASAFCPSKCTCNDLELTANCTQVGAISIVPMTLNPQLKRLTLNQLPLSELSNSLALYRQLELLNLNANQLRQVKYENFNFKPAPKLVHLGQVSGGSASLSGVQVASEARQLKHSLERQLGASWPPDEDEIRFHLRQLHLANNKLETLGELQQGPAASFDQAADGADAQGRKSLRAPELERLAPFLSLSKLELLDLSGNRLARLQQHVFLGLWSLKQLELANNQLEWLDKRALVGLIALERLSLAGNKLLRHQHQLGQLGQTLCLGPLMELRQLDLSENAPLEQAVSRALDDEFNQPAPHLILPNQMFSCAPKLEALSLRALRLKYVQTMAFDELRQLETLDLSDNLFTQVPLGDVDYERAQQYQDNGQQEHEAAAAPLANLRELKLSRTPIEFVNANAFGALKQLRRLELNQASQLVSFDFAALQTSGRSLNANFRLEELQLQDNRKLQALRCSSCLQQKPMVFHKLRQLNLSGAANLRDFHLDATLDLAAFASSGRRLEVDISNSNNLNCSSCQLNWLIDAFKQRRPAPFAGSAASSIGSSNSNNRLGWSPIPFDPYNSFVAGELDGQLPSGAWQPQQQRLGQAQSPAAAAVQLLNFDLINCAWPFSMPLIELINLETNYAPLFGHSCPQAAPARPLTNNQNNIALEHPALVATSAAAAASNQQRQQQQQQQIERALPPARPTTSTSAQETPPAAWPPAAQTLAGLLLLASCLALLLLLLAKLRLLLGQRRKLHLNSSPSFTATTPIDSPSSACGSSAGSGGQQPQQPQPQQQRRRELVANPLATAAAAAANSHYYYAPAANQLARFQAQREAALATLQATRAHNNSRFAAAADGAALVQAARGQQRGEINEVPSAAALAEIGRDAGELGRPAAANLFSRFAARLSGGATSGRRGAAPERRDRLATGIGTSLRPNGSRAPCPPSAARPPRAPAQATAVRVGPPPPPAPIYGRACEPPATFGAYACKSYAPSVGAVANHYSICGGGGGGDDEQETQAAHHKLGQAAAGVSRKNKRRRRRLDDNHTNGHLNQLHAAYNQLEAAATTMDDDDESGRFIYANG